jgi:alpha-galactosidase
VLFSGGLVKKIIATLLLMHILLCAAGAFAADFHEFSRTPPRGWNSWDSFGTTVTEKQIKEQADAMAKILLPAGYNILTVDIQWYEPNSVGHAYNPDAVLSMDDYGRLMPALKKFPSAVDGAGFKPLADYVHGKGLLFGIHIMRGIPKQAVNQNTQVLGAAVRARDIALTDSTCSWNPDMYGIDATKQEGQAYYDSIIQLYASWGVDYIKVDDIARPYDDIQSAEIEAIRKAIDKSGRSIVLSLSPGATPVSKGKHVSNHANLWRITDDFWDRWGLLHAMFERLDVWTPYRQPGAWPDADMIPLGIVDFGRPTRFTPDEQYTLMSLWSIARSPLIFGGDMTRLDKLTTRLLTNNEVLRVNQNSFNNRQISRNNNLIVWAADVPGSRDKYVALFNAQSRGDAYDFSQADYVSPVFTGPKASQKIEVSIKNGKRLVFFVKDSGDGNYLDHAVWENPTLHGSAGSIKLTSLDWVFAEADWGTPHKNYTVEGKPIIIDGQHIEGVGTHADSIIAFDIPEGYESFTSQGVSVHNGSVVFAVLVDRGIEAVGETSLVSVDFKDLGISGKAKVHDLWAHGDLGEFNGVFGRELRLHASGLYRVSP